MTESPPEDRLIISDNGIWVNGKNGWYQVATFGLKLLYRIADSNDNILWQAAILDGEKEEPIELLNEELATPARFHTALLKRGYVFKGDKYELNLIKESLIPQAKQAEHVSILGHHKSGVFVFGNGVFNGKFSPPDDLGMCEHKDQAYFLPFAHKLHLSSYKNAARFVHVPGDTTFDEWVTLYAQAHLRQGLFPVLFKVAAMFRDVAIKHLHYFPLLYLRGPHGTGKSRIAQGLTALDGYPQPVFSLKAKNTVKSLPRTLAQTSNAVVWFDEWYEGLDDGVKGTLQGVYDNAGYYRSERNQGVETNSVDILSSVVLTSNYLPIDPIFLSRCCVVTVPSATKTDAQKEAFDKLSALETKGLSCVTGELLTLRELICRKWAETYEETYAHFRQTCGNTLDTRTMSNMSIILTPAIILEKAGKIHLKRAYKALYDHFDLKEIGRTHALMQQNFLSGTSELNTFFTIINSLVETGRVHEGQDYRIKFGKDKKPFLALRMNTLYPQYLKEHRALYNKVGLTKNDLESLLFANPSFIKLGNARFGKGKERDLPVLKNIPILDFEGLQGQFDLNF